MDPAPPEKTLLKYLIAGGFGGICTTLCGHPFDTIKVRMQSVPGTYIGTFDATVKIVKNEGISGLYKGMSAPLVGVVPIFALSFFGFEAGKKLLANDQNELKSLSPAKLLLAGMFSGITTTIFSVPGERIKCLLQMQIHTDNIKYNGFWDCAVKLIRAGGVPNLYVGTCATLLRDIPAGGFYFGAYEMTTQFFSKHTTKTSIWQPVLAGGLAGIAHWLVAMPADVLKSRIQISSKERYPRGLRSAFNEMMKNEGPRGLYNGVVPIIIRSFPANAACFLGIEVAIKFLNKHMPSI